MNPYILIHDKKDVECARAAARAGSRLPRPVKSAADRRRGSRRRSPGHTGRQHHPAASSRSAAVKAPGFGDRRKAILEDIAVLTNGQVVVRGSGPVAGEDARSDRSGSVPSASSSPRKTPRSSTVPAKRRRSSRASSQIKVADRGEPRPTMTSEKLQERVAKLAGGVAVIKVGAGDRDRDEGKEGPRRRRPARHARSRRRRRGRRGGGVALIRARDQASSKA